MTQKARDQLARLFLQFSGIKLGEFIILTDNFEWAGIQSYFMQDYAWKNVAQNLLK